MVRLKVKQIENKKSNFKISIPYGAIKSNNYIKLYNADCMISIPYGAIKRQNFF